VIRLICDFFLVFLDFRADFFLSSVHQFIVGFQEVLNMFPIHFPFIISVFNSCSFLIFSVNSIHLLVSSLRCHPPILPFQKLHVLLPRHQISHIPDFIHLNTQHPAFVLRRTIDHQRYLRQFIIYSCYFSVDRHFYGLKFSVES